MSVCLLACNSVKIILVFEKNSHYALYSSKYLYCVEYCRWVYEPQFRKTGIEALHYASQYTAFIVSLLLFDLSFQVYNISFDLISESITCINYGIILKWKGCANTLR